MVRKALKSRRAELNSFIPGDHIFGILPLLASRLNGAGGIAEGVDDPRAQGGQSDQEVHSSRILTVAVS